jgi:hypothetical protein
LKPGIGEGQYGVFLPARLVRLAVEPEKALLPPR